MKGPIVRWPMLMSPSSFGLRVRAPAHASMSSGSFGYDSVSGSNDIDDSIRRDCGLRLAPLIPL